ncbi:hypothetical protein OAQ96_01860 [Alphaproteobacteria bacterium]|nr:hypothetical protein [Alphaproteobacteria bacterium]
MRLATQQLNKLNSNMIFNNFIYLLYKLFISLRRIFLFREKKNFFIKNLHINEIKLKNSDIFFGYYDLDPFNQKLNEVLIHIKSKKTNKVSLAKYNLITKKICIFDTSELWNFQFGARLSWLKNNKISANKTYNGEAKNYIWKLENNKISISTIIDFPIFDWNYDASKGLTLNFFELDKFRKGYGYLSDKVKNPIKNSSLYIYHIVSNTLEEVITLFQAKKKIFYNKKNPNIYNEHFNHPKWSPDGSSFLVLYVFNTDINRQTKLIYYNISLKKMKIWSNEDSEIISHFCWVSNNEFIFSGKMINTNFGYFRGFIDSHKFLKINEITIPSDGHPSFNISSNTMVLDTYPDRYSEQNLYYLDFTVNKFVKICSLLSPLKYIDNNKCDLHPRITKNGKMIIIDSSYTGDRTILIIEDFNEFNKLNS